MQTKDYVVASLELHLFFGRIMKEHAFFLKSGFTPAGERYSAKADFFKNEFEKLLDRAVSLSNGLISENVLQSGEIVTKFTAAAECQTERYTGISINQGITGRTLKLCTCKCRNIVNNSCHVKALNRTALSLLNGLIALKEEILDKVLHCQIFTLNYPLLIEHILREAKLYRKYVQMLESDGTLSMHSMKEVECFWNQIMMEHALFIRGLLDPSENELIHSADKFADDYSVLLKACCKAQERTMPEEVLAKTKQFRDFKSEGTKGISNCQIRSLILPLLADHVLREANHYIRILEEC